MSQQFGNGDAVSYLYDQGRRMTSKEAKNKNSDLINHYKYGYNKVHMKNYEQRMHENGIGNVFGYDAVYRLTNAKFNVPDPTVENPTDFDRERNIFLDHIGNITKIDETKNGETTQITTEIPPDTDYAKLNQYSRFDKWGLTYDTNGNLTQKGTQKMYYNYRNQMVRVTEGTTTTENKYDALGRRLQKIVTTGSQSKTENYYYSGHQVIEVRDGNDQVKRQFIYGNGIDEVIRMDAYNGSAITPYYFHTNAIGSTTAVTDANGNVVERYKYGLYGISTFMDAAGNVIPKSAIGNNILFQGREYEPETNFYYFRARHLDPIMGRFLQTDPMGYEDSLNLYQAFNMNPINFNDPMGLKIRFTGEDRENDFKIFKSIFINIGISDIDNIMELDENGFVVLKRGKGSLINAGERGKNLERRNEGGFYGWLRYGTQNLKNYKEYHNLTMEEMFEYIINDPETIEFQINPKKLSEYKFKKYGGGIFLEKSDRNNFSLDRNHQIVIRGEGASLVRFLSLSVGDIIAHEFGHAYAFLKGFKPDQNDTENMFGELAVMAENLYRLRSSYASVVSLRPLHDYGYLNEPYYSFTNLLYGKLVIKEWMWYVYDSNGLVGKRRPKLKK